MNEQHRKKLPLGVQSFREIREGDYYYVDKTAYAHELNSMGLQFFIARPHQFGKTLFLDMLKELCQGSEDLFRGLAVHEKWDWSVQYPVVSLRFGDGDFDQPGGLDARLDEMMTEMEASLDLERREKRPEWRLSQALDDLRERTGQRVVVLIDEYDKPILDAINNPEVAKANRSSLIGFYTTLKGAPEIHFALLTGVTKFTWASIFSGLNHLINDTLSRDTSSLFGFTQDELDTVFAPELEGLDRDKIRDLYFGYSWDGNDRVYNPYDILSLFDRREYQDWWYQTAPTKYVVDTLIERRMRSFGLGQMYSDHGSLMQFDFDDVRTEAMLFQIGYTTILREDREDGEAGHYILGCANEHIHRNLNAALLEAMTAAPDESAEARQRREDRWAQLHSLLTAGDAGGLEAAFRDLLADIPPAWSDETERSGREWSSSLFYSYCVSAGFDVRVEETARTQVEIVTVSFEGHVWIVGFKVLDWAYGDNTALGDVIEQGYAEQYRDGRRIVLVGAEFNNADRKLVTFETSEA